MTEIIKIAIENKILFIALIFVIGKFIQFYKVLIHVNSMQCELILSYL